MPRVIFAGTDAHEGDTIAVVFIHIGLHLEHKAGKFRLGWRASSRVSVCLRTRGGGHGSTTAFKSSRTPKLWMRRAKKHRCQVAFKIGLLHRTACRRRAPFPPPRGIARSSRCRGTERPQVGGRLYLCIRYPGVSHMVSPSPGIEYIEFDRGGYRTSRGSARPCRWARWQRRDIKRQRFFDIVQQRRTDRCASRSILLMKVMMGVSRRRQTSNSLRVCASMPLAASSTMTAESTAVSVR